MIDHAERELARVDPALVFPTPEAILEDATLSRDEKLELLRRWRYDAIELNVALDEGMGRESSHTLDRILDALASLGAADARRPDRHS